MDRKRKIPITTLIRAIDEPELLPKHPSAKDIKEIQAKIEAAKTEREADKLRHQLLQVLGTNDRVLALFEDIDNGPDHRYIKATLDRDPTSANKEEALLEFYRRLRPGDPPTIENAKRADQLAVLQPPSLRPGQGRPLQGQQAPGQKRRNARPRAGPQ